MTSVIFNVGLVFGGVAEVLGRFLGGPVIQNLQLMHLKIDVAVIWEAGVRTGIHLTSRARPRKSSPQNVRRIVFAHRFSKSPTARRSMCAISASRSYFGSVYSQLLLGGHFLVFIATRNVPLVTQCALCEVQDKPMMEIFEIS